MGYLKNCQSARTQALLALCRAVFTASIPGGKWLAQDKNPSLPVILPVFGYTLIFAQKKAPSHHGGNVL